MITRDDAIRICMLKHLTDIQMLEVIERYIYEKKGIKVSIDRPENSINIQLMNIAFDVACVYFLSN